MGILGGTFDPVHTAHVALARTAADQLGLDQVVWIPAGNPPHRAAPRAAPDHRLAMTRLAIADEPRFVLDASEANSTAASYTVHTLERLRSIHGDRQPLVLLMGADALRGLASWHRWRDLLSLAHIGVATRPGFPLDDLPLPVAELFAASHTPCEACHPANVDFSLAAGTIVPFALSAGTVSATEVRTLMAQGAPRTAFDGLLPPAVLDYILSHSLYSA